MHLRKVLKLRRKCRQGIGDEEEKVRDSDEETAEEEPLPSHTDETSGETDSLWVPNADELHSNNSSSSRTLESVICSGGESPDAGAGAVHASEESAAELENLVAKQVYHTRLLTV